MSIPLIYRDNNANNNLYKDYLERSEQIWIKYDKRISVLCHISKNLYNAANFQIRKEYKEYNHYMGYHALDNLMKDNENYRNQLYRFNAEKEEVKILVSLFNYIVSEKLAEKLEEKGLRRLDESEIDNRILHKGDNI